MNGPRSRSTRGRRAAVAAAAALLLLAAHPAPASAEPVRWSGRDFESVETLERWLNGRGVQYSTWAERHPIAARKLEASFSVEPDLPRAPAADARATEADLPTWTAWALAATGLVLIVAPLALWVLAPRAGPRTSPADWRQLSVFVGCAILVGAAITLLLS